MYLNKCSMKTNLKEVFFAIEEGDTNNKCYFKKMLL